MDANIIKIRRAEIDKQLSLLRESVAVLETELAEIEIAERVFDRLTGAKRYPVSTANEQDATTSPIAAAVAKPSVRDMIKEAFMDARQRGVDALEPKDMRDYIKRVYNVDVGQQANTNASRMFHQLKELEKDENGLFRLVSKEKPTDNTTVESPSAGLFSINPEHDREAGQGGGT